MRGAASGLGRGNLFDGCKGVIETVKKILLLVSLFASLAILAQGQTQVVPMTNPHIQLLDASGKPCAGCLLDTFTAGTTSALATFSESTGTSLNSNPVVADANGYVTVYFQLTSYKLRLRSAAGITIYTQDGVSPVSPLSPITFPVIVRAATAATNGANQSSPTLCFNAFYFNITSLTDQWCLQDVIGTGAAPTSTFSVTHSGSGGTTAINLPVGLQLNFAQSTLANAASSGFERLATTDQDCWRNVANGADVCLSDAGVAAAGTGNLADLLKWGGGGLQAAAFVDKNANPAQSGVVRTGNNVCAVASRNAAASGDVCAVQVNTLNQVSLSNTAQDTINQQAATAFTIKDNQGGTRYSVPSGGVAQATINNTNLTGASNSNTVTLLNEQGPTGALTGNSADQTVYTYTMPANTLQAGKGVRIRYWANHNSGAVAVTHKVFFGATPFVNNSDSTTGQAYFECVVFNNSGVTNAQHGSNNAFYPGTAFGTTTGITSAIDTTASVVIKATFNVASPNQVTGGQFVVDLIQ